MTRDQLKAVAAWARPQRAALAGGAALMTLESAAALALPWMAGQFAGRIWPASAEAPGTGQWAIASLIALMVAAAFVQALLQVCSGYLLARTGGSLVADLQQRVYDHLQALPMAYFHARRLGDSLALLTSDVHQVGSYITQTLVSIAPLLFTVTGAAIVMFAIQPWLALLCMVAVPMFVILLKLLGRRLRPLSDRLSQEYSAAYALFEENLSMLPAIKSFTREPQESQRVDDQVQRIRLLTQRQALIQSGLGPMVQFIALTGLLLLLWLVSGRLGSGELKPADLVSFLLYANLLSRPVPMLANVYTQTQITRAALSRILRAMEQPIEPAGAPAAAMADATLRGDIRFDAVHFAYPGRAAVLHGLHLHVVAGETVAIVGHNGSGKSTLSYLLLRLVSPDAGRILLDGRNLADLDLRTLRSQIGLVPQFPLLFHASVYDNIAYGLPQSTAEQVHRAARQACAHDFIAALPQGYDTLIGDRGVRLSGGQQQRLALARALLKDPAILILDEATSMFDPEAETEFLAIAKQALAGRTVLLITHRPASLALADRVLQLTGGLCVDVTVASTSSARKNEALGGLAKLF